MISSNWYDYSTCKGCPYGERISGGVFCSQLQGLVPVGYVGCKAERDFYEEIDKKENGITLTELAHELRKIFKFKYLTVRPIFYRDSYNNIDEYCGDAIELWDKKPRFLSDEGFWEEIFSDGEPTGRFGKEYLHTDSLVAYLDLGLSKTIEEMFEDGDLSEYEKCIVEVEE